MANFYIRNVKGFEKAAGQIANNCSEFAGGVVGGGLDTYPLAVLERAFSKCDDAVAAINFDCVVKAEKYRIPCIAEVSTDGKVRFLPKREIGN